MDTERPIGHVKITKATPRDSAFSDRLPWYSEFIKYSLREYKVYLDNTLEFPLVDPTTAGFTPGTYAAITRCDARLVKH